MISPFGFSGGLHIKETDVSVVLVIRGAASPRGSADSVLTEIAGLRVQPPDVQAS